MTCPAGWHWFNSPLRRSLAFGVFLIQGDDFACAPPWSAPCSPVAIIWQMRLAILGVSSVSSHSGVSNVMTGAFLPCLASCCWRHGISFACSCFTDRTSSRMSKPPLHLRQDPAVHKARSLFVCSADRFTKFGICWNIALNYVSLNHLEYVIQQLRGSFWHVSTNNLEMKVSQGAVNEINALKDQFGISPQAHSDSLHGCWVILDVDVNYIQSRVKIVAISQCCFHTLQKSFQGGCADGGCAYRICTSFNHFDSVFLIASTAAAVVYRPPSYRIALKNNVLGLTKAFTEIIMRDLHVCCKMNACVLFKGANCHFFLFFFGLR